MKSKKQVMITKEQLEESRNYASTMDKKALKVFEILVTQGYRNVPKVEDLQYLESVIKSVEKVYNIGDYTPDETYVEGSYGGMIDQEILRLMENQNDENMKQKVKKLFKKLPKDTLLNIDILYNYFKQHPKWDEKITNGLNGFIIKKNEWNYSFHVVGDNNKYTPISFNFDIKEDHLDRVKKALRTEVQPIVDQVRNSVIYGKSKCHLTGEILTQKNTHIDHYNLDFRFLVDEFTKKYEKIEVVKKGVKFYLLDENIKKEWIEFHNNNTNLRPVTALANQKRSKKL